LYPLKLTDGAVADVKAIPKDRRNRLRSALLEILAEDPAGCSKPLQRELAGFRSFAHGAYRVVFRIFDDPRAIVIAGVGLRSPQSTDNVYRKLERLAAAGRLAQGMLASLRGFTDEGG
jgi:mRNA-degrading endonuclease RelE of RelBE toxin-antitoxin system